MTGTDFQQLDDKKISSREARSKLTKKIDRTTGIERNEKLPGDVMNVLLSTSLTSISTSDPQDASQKLPFIFAAGNGFPESIIASQRKILSSAGLDTAFIGPGEEVASAKNLIDNLATRLQPGTHLLLHIHGQLDMKNQHRVMFAESEDGLVNTVSFLEQLMSQAQALHAPQQKSYFPLPILHVMSCNAGVLAEEILPNSPLWNSAYIVLYASSKTIISSHYHTALASAAAYVSFCENHDKPVDPMQLFYLAGCRRGDGMRLLGGNLRAPLVLNAPKLANHLTPAGLGRRLKGSVDDIADFFLMAIETGADSRQSTDTWANALVEVLDTRIQRRDLSSVKRLLAAYPSIVNPPASSTVAPIISALFWSAERNEIAKQIVDRLLREPIDLAQTDSYGNGPVLVTLPRKDPDLLQRLLRRGANPNEKNTSGTSPLWVATYLEFYAGIKLLLEFGADINFVRQGETALTLAVRRGDPITVELLLNGGAGPQAGLSQALADRARQGNDFEIAEMLEAALARHQAER